MKQQWTIEILHFWAFMWALMEILAGVILPVSKQIF